MDKSLTVGDLSVSNHRSSETGSSRARYFVAIEGYDFYLDEVGNPCYWDKNKHQGFWLVSDFLSGIEIEKSLLLPRVIALMTLGFTFQFFVDSSANYPRQRNSGTTMSMRELVVGAAGLSSSYY